MKHAMLGAFTALALQGNVVAQTQIKESICYSVDKVKPLEIADIQGAIKMDVEKLCGTSYPQLDPFSRVPGSMRNSVIVVGKNGDIFYIPEKRIENFLLNPTPPQVQPKIENKPPKYQLKK